MTGEERYRELRSAPPRRPAPAPYGPYAVEDAVAAIRSLARRTRRLAAGVLQAS